MYLFSCLLLLFLIVKYLQKQITFNFNWHYFEEGGGGLAQNPHCHFVIWRFPLWLAATPPPHHSRHVARRTQEGN